MSENQDGPGEVNEVEDKGPQTLREKRVVKVAKRSMRTRMWALLFVVVVVLGVYGWTNNRAAIKFERQIVANCHLINGGHAKFNTALDQLIANTANNPAFNPARRQAAIKVYRELYLPIITCPPRP